MSEASTGTESTSTPAPEAATAAPETFSRDYVEGLRQEAAKYRNEKKDAVESAKADARTEVLKEYEPKLAERDTEITSLKETLASQATELLKLKAVIDAKVPSEDIATVVDLVQGNDEESISASVERVLSIYGKKAQLSPAYDHSQGRGGTPPALNSDALLGAVLGLVGK